MLKKIIKWGGLAGLLYGVLALVLSNFGNVEKTLLWWGEVLALITGGGTAFVWEWLPKFNIPTFAPKANAKPKDDYLEDLRVLKRISAKLEKGGDSESVRHLSDIAVKLFDLYHLPEVDPTDLVEKVLPEVKSLVEKEVKEEVQKFFKERLGA